ncbi:MAG: 50S ribosomal protein L21 [Holosporales bacterium]|jgi:large subunit ribosomal protein L21|nr:50S ribosomal protein L21 [Holosporales bacterium]
MFAIIKTGGKQYRVSPGDVILVEKLDTVVGEAVELNEVLAIKSNSNEVILGEPLVNGWKVVAKVLNQIRDRKILVFKKKRRHNYRRKNGHRQHLSVLKITDIVVA